MRMTFYQLTVSLIGAEHCRASVCLSVCEHVCKQVKSWLAVTEMCIKREEERHKRTKGGGGGGDSGTNTEYKESIDVQRNQGLSPQIM